ncbi:AIC_G0051740.mRNA.1.CDS.1 [Saccharomyces cerevisiae]|nr:Dgk1p [Saccharomyces cerevisiae YJM270]PTN18519.1 diacylglycerol kinase [Saccharomyces cerevisiae]PTN22549.1 diacylglycerol kinase [Saccharomyces cerevisiae]PTN35945.1 diacylglycerol kinase [Saccharomyces cerevisiae]CAI4786386.1 AIC_G0051740.mRNA.1.CDS.1 [Saccharomyces cerevisiae]
MGTEDAIALPNSTLEPRTEAKQRLSSKSHQVSAKVTIPAEEEISSSDDDAHVPVTEIHLKSHEWFGDFITKHEIPRKVFHSSIGFITLYLYTQGINYKNVLWPLIYAFIILFILDLIRLNWPFFNMLYCRTVGALMRKKEIHTYNGVLWYILGLIFSFNFFSKDVTLISLFLLSWSDTAAATIGRKYGHLTPKLARNKSLAGSIAAFTVGVITCWVFYGYFVPAYSYVNKPGEIQWSPETSRLSLNMLSLLGGVVAALSEGIDLFNWDDNFTIPVLSSLFMNAVIKTFKK